MRTLALIGLVILFSGLLLVYAMGVIWALNTLFGLGIEVTPLNTLATLLLMSVFAVASKGGNS